MRHRLGITANGPAAARRSAPVWLAVAVVATGLAGCGTTSGSDTKRTATEQLLVSDAIERAVMQIDMRPLAGRAVFLDTTVLADVADKDYLASAVRQHVLGSGCILAANREDAEIIVEARAGTLGTDRTSLLLGMPATQVEVAGNGTSIPELVIFKRSGQRAVAKINLFAYHRTTGTPVWQSGAAHIASRARDRWFMNAGPFQDGRIHDRMEFAGESLRSTGAKTIEDGEAVVGTFDLMATRVFATAPPGSPADRTADERPVDLPSVR